MRLIKAEAQAYTDLATAYTSKKQQDLPSAIEKHQGQFVEVRFFLKQWYLGQMHRLLDCRGILSFSNACLQRHIKLVRVLAIALVCQLLYAQRAVRRCSICPSSITGILYNLCVLRCQSCLQDGNMGLVKLVLAGRTKRAIQKLTQTFLTLSLADIAQQVGLQSAAEAEGHILRYRRHTCMFDSYGSCEQQGRHLVCASTHSGLQNCRHASCCSIVDCNVRCYRSLPTHIFCNYWLQLHRVESPYGIQS